MAVGENINFHHGTMAPKGCRYNITALWHRGVAGSQQWVRGLVCWLWKVWRLWGEDIPPSTPPDNTPPWGWEGGEEMVVTSRGGA